MKRTDIRKNSVMILAMFFLARAFMLYGGTEVGFDKYKIIAEQNIFARYKRIITGDESDGVVMQTKVVSLYILRGVGLKGDEKIAFVENEIGGEYIRVKIGEDIAGFKVKDIRTDLIVLEKDREELNVKVGAEIYRETKEVAVGRTEQVKIESAETKVEGALPATGEDEILKMMLERRKRELGN